MSSARASERGRFAPSTTGHAHPGTLLAGLLAWLDARSRGASFVLRLEDIDPERCKPEFSEGLVRDLGWLGLDWDALVVQHERAAAHARALDRLAELGVLYPCSCSRAALKASGRRAPDGSFAYPNTCRGRVLPAGGWRESSEPLRVRLPEGVVAVSDEGGLELSQEVSVVMGDPIVRRRDGAVAYQLAVVVDDGEAGVTRIVRGKDIAPSTATQVALMGYLGLPVPSYRHHLLLLEPRGDKLAKLHGSVGAPELRGRYSAEALVGFLAHAVGLAGLAAPVSSRELLAGFDWGRVRKDDVALIWTGSELSVAGAPPPTPSPPASR